jgi:hypothetical protein
VCSGTVLIDLLSEISGCHSGEYENDLYSEMLRRVVPDKLTDVLDVVTIIVTLVMAAVSASET